MNDKDTKIADADVAPLILPQIAPPASDGPIDAIVTWVDGDDPQHRRKRVLYQDTKIEGAAKSKLRFRDTDEIRFCLRSIRNNAPWIRNIWLVTDNQFPKSINKGLAEQEGIRVVDHAEIFSGYESYLPSFNSLSIETFMWRIPGVADRFIYFNDDVLLTAPLAPEDFYKDGKVVLRGKWKNAEKLKTIPWGIQNQIESAKRTGFSTARFWAPAHVAHAMYRPVLEALYHANRAAFEENASHRFRKKTQWWSVSIHNNCLIKNNRATTRKPSDTIHFSVKFCRGAEPAEAKAQLRRAAKHEAKLICVNDLVALLDKAPGAIDKISAATGPARPFERILPENPEDTISRLKKKLRSAQKKVSALQKEIAEANRKSAD